MLLEVIYPLLMGVVNYFVSALFLMISTKIFKTENNNYKTALKVLLLPIILSIILSIIFSYISSGTLLTVLWILSFVILLILNIWLIKKNYLVTTGRAILIFIVALVMSIIPVIIISMIIGVLFVASTFI
jgi:hypothetical protein